MSGKMTELLFWVDPQATEFSHLAKKMWPAGKPPEKSGRFSRHNF